jgi:DNA (cytosine-5)-methyltransferase 1
LTCNASPGGNLPDLGPDTHTKHPLPGSGMKSWTSVNSVLAAIPRNAPNHDSQTTPLDPLKYGPWDGSRLCPCLMTGSHPCHPNGKRRLTSRELAALQGFPCTHVFYGNKTLVNGMIGDAVPPVMMQKVFESIKKVLEKEDGGS